MRIAVIDDLKSDRQLLISRLNKLLSDNSINGEIYEFEKGIDFINASKQKAFEVAFMDIYIDKENGIEISKLLREFDKECILIFTTTSSDYALEGFKVRAFDYLVKPYTTDELKIAFTDILNRLPSSDKYIEVKVIGGTQTNVTVISAALKHYQGVITAKTGHINIHETGALEACGHKCLCIETPDGKLTAEQIAAYTDAHFADESFEHMVQPKMVYISNPTEIGTIYKKAELEAIYQVCKERGLYLFMDGARLGYGLMCKENDLTLSDITVNTDVFYIGGTKVGALFGEAVVIRNEELKKDFRYNIKQRGGMLAKGRLLGIQFLTLFEENRYFDISAHAARLAEKLKDELIKMGVKFYIDSPTNQQFPILPDAVLAELKKKYSFAYQERMDETHSAVRFCTCWATKEENVDMLLADNQKLLAR